jgi:cytochrome c553
MQKLTLSLAAASLMLCSSLSVASDDAHSDHASSYASEADVPQLGSAEAGAEKVAVCASCHGDKGQSAIADNPKLAGQSAKYIAQQLFAFQTGVRENAIMQGQVGNLSEEDMRDIGAYYESQGIAYAEFGEGDHERGKEIYLAGIPKQNVPACIGCHGIDGKGIGPTGYPVLAGQHEKYLNTRLSTMADGDAETENALAMKEIAARLRKADREALASYIQGLHP